MKKKVCLLCALCALAVALCGCAARINLGYANEEKYTVGGGDVSGAVESLDINWIDGGVTIRYAAQDHVTIEETAKKTLSQQETVHWLLDGNTLRVQYGSAKLMTVHNLQKQLTVTLPEGLALENVTVNSTSGNINANPLYAKQVELSVVSGNVSAECAAQRLTVSSTSGKIDVTAAAGEISLNSTSGTIKGVIEHADHLKANTTSGDVELTAQEVKAAEVNSVSGKVTVSARQAMEQAKIDTVSGAVRLLLAGDTGFTADVSTVSGAVRCDLPARADGKRYTAGDGSMKINVNTVSGSATLAELTER